jgi:hypothetical protein
MDPAYTFARADQAQWWCTSTPEPVLPTSFTIQLYNPDQQVVITQKPGSWGHNQTWSFDLPSQSFRKPSASTLDRTQDDPLALEITPKIRFKWKNNSKLSKDLVCLLSGVSTNPDGTKKKNKEPDITVPILKSLKEMTLYKPNLQSLHLEDMMGFSLAVLLRLPIIARAFCGVQLRLLDLKWVFWGGQTHLSELVQVSWGT